MADPVSSAASWAVQKGMENFLFSIGDSMVNLNDSTNPIARQETPGLIFNMIGFTIDPFSLAFVKEWWGTSLIFFVMIAVIYICAGGAMALLSTLNPGLVQRLAWLESGTYQNNFELKRWISNIILALMFPMCTYFGIYFILQLCYVVTGIVTQGALNAVPPTADNIVIYVFMAAAYLMFSVIMGIRNIVIVLFAAGGLMLAALYLIPSLQNLVRHIFIYFLLLVFMQPLLVFVASVGIMFMAALPLPLMGFQIAIYFGLVVLLLFIAIIMMFGYGFILRLIGVGRVAL